ncbi:MAG: hypothetical protein KDA61_03575 [Planctomycetales bacterium]|nr:hypothetical protein [Planctomycetales bacterium]
MGTMDRGVIQAVGGGGKLALSPWRWRFSLRTLAIGMIVASVAMASVMRWVRQRHEVLERIRLRGGSPVFVARRPALLRTIFGDAAGCRVVAIHFDADDNVRESTLDEIARGFEADWREPTYELQSMFPEVETVSYRKYAMNLVGVGKKFVEWRRLHTLKFESCEVFGQSLAHIDQHPALRSVTLEECKADETSLRWISRIPHLDSLVIRTADEVASNEARPWSASDETLDNLSDARFLKRLRLGRCWVTNDGLAKLAKVASLEELECISPHVTSLGVRAPVDLPVLRVLEVSGARLGDGRLAGLREFPSLQELCLDRLPDGENRLTRLALPASLTKLTLRELTLTEDELSPLYELRRLKTLDLTETAVTSLSPEANALKAALPGCTIKFP